MLDQVIGYLGAHPAIMSAMCVTAVLAAVGLWYVVSHHLQAILITLLTAAGIGSGMLVLFRGFRTDTKDLMGIGLFLIVIFPVIFCGSSQWNLNQPPIMLSQSGHEPRPLSRPAVPTYWFAAVVSGTIRVMKLA